MSRFQVKKVAVLGAGVMGAQIAAHLVNVKVPVVLFDLPAKEGPKNGIVTKAIDNLKKLKPAPLGVAEDAALIGQANYEEHLEQLRDCDLIIEAIAERMDWKLDLYKKIAPFIGAQPSSRPTPRACRSPSCPRRCPTPSSRAFCGIHFFNPPRYMALVELINTPTTEAALPRRAGGLCHQHAGQGRGACQGFAQLHRQPRGHRRHAGHHEGGRELRPDLRRGR
jgi:3-hydroxyacyl-CoA dehydrogenase